MAGAHGTARPGHVRALAARGDSLFTLSGQAGWWEPCKSRGLRTVLGEPGGEIPPGYSPLQRSIGKRQVRVYRCGVRRRGRRHGHDGSDRKPDVRMARGLEIRILRMAEQPGLGDREKKGRNKTVHQEG